jgi:hypothetical protein
VAAMVSGSAGRRDIAIERGALWYDPSDGSRLTRPHVQLFTIFFSRPVEFGLATAMTVLMLIVIVRATFSAEGPNRVSRFVTKPSGKYLFAAAFIAWAVMSAIALAIVPHEGANTPYGGIGLISMFVGLFIMMGLIWAVVGE